MARRKRRSQKLQQQQDETLIDLVEARDQAQDFMERNQNMLFGGLVLIVLLIGGYLAYKNFYVAPQQEAAVNSMWAAENQFAQDSFALAIDNPGGGNLGFADIADEYGAAKASTAANYYNAVGYLNLGQYDAAISYLNNISADGEILPIMKPGLLGDAYSEKGEFDKAISYYKQAATARDNEVLSPYYWKKYALLNEKQGNADAAKNAYNTIKEKYPLSPDGRDIDKYVARINQ